MIEQYDSQEIYCRKLGHHLGFRYCRRADRGLPCATVRDCWFERLPIDEFLAGHYSAEQLTAVGRPPPAKLNTLLEVLARVRGNTGS